MPVLFVLTLVFIKETYDDYLRHIRDKESNEFFYIKVDLD